MGWLAPTTVIAKLLIQELWQKQISWDAPVPSDIQERWYQYRRQLKHLEDIIIPRWTEQ